MDNMDTCVLPDQHSKWSPEYIYSVTEEFLNEIRQALGYAWTNFDAYIDPRDSEAVMNDPAIDNLINNLPPELVDSPPPSPPPLFSPPITIPNNGDNNNDVYKKFEELDFQHRELMESASTVAKAVDYLVVYYCLKKDGVRPPNYTDLVSTVEWFTARMVFLYKSYRAKLGIISPNCDNILSSDNASSCLDLMIQKFRQMELMKTET